MVQICYLSKVISPVQFHSKLFIVAESWQGMNVEFGVNFFEIEIKTTVIP